MKVRPRIIIRLPVEEEEHRWCPPTGEGQLATLNLSDEKDFEWFHGLKHILLAFVFTRGTQAKPFVCCCPGSQLLSQTSLNTKLPLFLVPM